MLTQKVFLDTTNFDGNAYNFKSAKLRSLVEEVKKGSIKVFITDVVDREIKAHIKKAAEEGYSEISKFRASPRARIIKHITDPPLSTALSATREDLERALLNEYETFLKEAEITIVSTKGLLVDDILDRYFDRQAPFEEKKKSEFPDAITLEALERWCKEHDEKMYVVSNDGGLKKYCDDSDSLEYLPDLSELLELVLEKEQKNALYYWLSLFNSNTEKINEKIGYAFQSIDLIEPNWHINTEFSEIILKNIELKSIHVISIDFQTAVMEADVNIRFSVNVTQDDMETASYDNEEGVLFPWRTKSYHIEEKVNKKATLEFSSNKEIPESWNDITLNTITLTPDTIEVDTSNYDYEFE